MFWVHVIKFAKVQHPAPLWGAGRDLLYLAVLRQRSFAVNGPATYMEPSVTALRPPDLSESAFN